MKKEYAIYARQTNEVIGGRIVWTTKPETVRVMARAEGYAMVRKPGAMPFVVSLKELSEIDERKLLTPTN